MKKDLLLKSVLLSGLMFVQGADVNAQLLKGQIKDAVIPVKTIKNVLPSNIVCQPMRTATNGVEKLPQTEDFFLWVNDNWEKQYTTNFVYNANYDVEEATRNIFENGSLTKSVMNLFEYNPNGTTDKLTVKKLDNLTEGAEWQNYTQTQYIYDAVSPFKMVQQKEFFWSDNSNEWVLDDWGGFYHEVTRDEANRVTSLIWWDSEMKFFASLGFFFEYEDGKEGAVRMTCKSPDDMGEFQPFITYEDIKWHKTDSQYLRMTSNTYKLFDRQDTENIPSSFTVYDYYSGEKAYRGSVSFEVDEQGRVTDYIIATDDICEAEITDYNVDENGSYSVYDFPWLDENKNLKYDKGEETSLSSATRERMVYDDHKNLILVDGAAFDETSGDFSDKTFYKQSYEYEYLEDGSVASELRSTYDEEGQNVVKKEKIEYSNFIDKVPTGINDASENVSLRLENNHVIAANGINFTITDMQGRIYRNGIVKNSMISLEGMPEGMYIIHAGGNAIKALVR